MGRGKRALGRRSMPVAASRSDLASWLAGLSDRVKDGQAMSPRGRARYAHAVVHQAAGIEPGDVLSIEAGAEEAELAVSLALEAYRAGARRVRVFSDRAALHAMDEALAKAEPASDFEWDVKDARDGSAWDEDVRAGAAFVSLNEGAEWDEAARAEYSAATADGQARWTTVYWPTGENASLAYPGDPEAKRKLADDLLHFTRSGPRDPLDGYERHLVRLRQRAESLNHLSLTAVVIESGATRLEVGLLSTSAFRPTEWATENGRRFAANLPSEEIFCTPDPTRVDGSFETARPLWINGPVYRIHGHFRNGELQRAGFVTEPAERAEEIYRYLAANPGLLAVGELALVGDDSRVAQARRVYYLNNVDENAGSHIALGESYRAGLREGVDDPRRNRQAQGHHHDLTVAGLGASVYGKTADGQRLPLIVDGQWQI